MSENRRGDLFDSRGQQAWTGSAQVMSLSKKRS